MIDPAPAARGGHWSLGGLISMWARGINGPGLLTIAAVLAAWEVAVRSGAIVYDYLPPPSRIVVALAVALVNGQIIVDILHTLRSVLLGWAIAGGIGIALGLLLGFSGT